MKNVFYSLVGLLLFVQCQKDDTNVDIDLKDQSNYNQMPSLKHVFDKIRKEQLSLREREKVLIFDLEWGEDQDSIIVTKVREEDYFPIGLVLNYEKEKEGKESKVFPRERTIYCYSKEDHRLLWKKICNGEYACYGLVLDCFADGGCASNKCPKVIVYSPLSNSIYLLPKTEQTIGIEKRKFKILIMIRLIAYC